MQGLVEVKLLETPGLTRDAVLAAKKIGSIEDFLAKFPVVQHVQNQNLVLYRAPSYFFKYAMSGAAAGGYHNSYHNFLGLAVLHTTSAEPEYSDSLSPAPYGNWNNLGENCTTDGTSYKGVLNEDIIEHVVEAIVGGREAIRLISKWLWLPGQCTSPAIRTLRLWNVENQAELSAAVRLKDSNGLPITLNKGATQSLYVSYTFIIPSL